MAKNLLVVESPAKAKTLKKFLGYDFVIRASVGHVKDLPETSLGVDIEKNFEPHYIVIRGKGKILAQIKKAAKEAERVYLAPDPDREGEAIAWHVAEEIKNGDKKIYRALFNEITKKAVLDSIKNPSKLDINKYSAQKARRILDRLVGYQISPILWKKVRRGLSAGRVQSVAVRMICEREKEIEKFVPEEYWTVDANLKGRSGTPFTARLINIGTEKAEIKSKDSADKIIERLNAKEYIVKNIAEKERKRMPPAPFITSSLQQDAIKKLGFTAKKTMMIAQRLYEGIELGEEGSVGLITYMRTDSTRLSDEALTQVRTYLEKRFGKEYVPSKPNFYKSKKSAQEAHEAIRPTYLEYEPEKIKEYLPKDYFELYELIWNRFLACQMMPALYDQTTVDINAEEFLFRATGSVMKFPGFVKIYIEGKDDTERDEDDKDILPKLEVGEKLDLLKLNPEQHFTKPPSRFSESTLIKELEEKGIGRPSTYAIILSNVQERHYVKKIEGKFTPTELGFLVTELLVSSFPNILDIRFTAEMENKLDQIEDGEINWIEVLNNFYSTFKINLDKAMKEMRNVKKEAVPTDIKCDVCGNFMVIRWGKHGEFLSCSNFPKCKNIKNFSRAEDGKIIVEKEDVQEDCELCGKPMVVKSGPYGKFLACSAYPECKNTKPLVKQIPHLKIENEICEKCRGKMLVKMSKRGGRFLACENYPKCKNTRPLKIGKKCPLCDGDLVERFGRGNIFYGCINYPDCEYTTKEI